MASEHESTRTAPSEYLLAVSLAVVLVAGGFLVSSLVLSLVLTPPLRGTADYAASTLIQGASFVLVVLAYVLYTDRPLLDVRWPSLSDPRRTLSDLGWVVAGFVVLLVASLAVGTVLRQFGLAPGTNEIVGVVRRHPTLGLYLVVLSFVATGPGEETLFRGGVQGVLRRVFSPVPAVMLSSALFGLAHVTAIVSTSGTGGVWGYVVSAFLLGLVLGGLYEYTDNLLVPILVHGAYNALQFAQVYLTETGHALGYLPF